MPPLSRSSIKMLNRQSQSPFSSKDARLRPWRKKSISPMLQSRTRNNGKLPLITTIKNRWKWWRIPIWPRKPSSASIPGAWSASRAKRACAPTCTCTMAFSHIAARFPLVEDHLASDRISNLTSESIRMRNHSSVRSTAGWAFARREIWRTTNADTLVIGKQIHLEPEILISIFQFTTRLMTCRVFRFILSKSGLFPIFHGIFNQTFISKKSTSIRFTAFDPHCV